MEPIKLNAYYTLICATIVLLIGRLLVRKIKFLRDFNIPEPVSGGLLAAAIIGTLYATTGISFEFDGDMQRTFMIAFFASIGLSADFSRLKQGGFPLVIFVGDCERVYYRAKPGRRGHGRTA